MINIAICDDDLKFLDMFSELITEVFCNKNQATTIYKYSSGKTLIEKVEKEKHVFNLIFLDVEMPELDGFQVAKRLRELNFGFILIFITYIEHQSREGYIYGAFRYIFKNNLRTELDEAVCAIINKLGYLSDVNDKICFKTRQSGILEDLKIKKDDIVLLQKEKSRRVILKSIYGQYELLVKPLSYYTSELEEPIFNIVMRNFIVNFNHVQSIENDHFVLTGNVIVPLGVKHKVRNLTKEKYLRYLEEYL